MSEDGPAATLASVDDQGRGVRVEFFKRGDRFSHTVFRVDGDVSEAIYESIEGSPDDLSPPSPPYAELHEQEGILFLSGATSLGHWSLSVAVKQGQIWFDVACRIKDVSDQLGSAYQIVTANELLTPVGDSLTQSTADTLQIGPAMQEPLAVPATLQWQYAIGDASEREQPTIRLDQFLKAHALVGTGGQAKLLIQDGQVLVNGEVETRRRRQLREGDIVQFEDQQRTVEYE